MEHSGGQKILDRMVKDTEIDLLFLLQNTVIKCGFYKGGKFLVWVNNCKLSRNMLHCVC
jgi:hypothetical protein